MSNLTQKVFTILDTKTEAYHTPFFQPTTAAALRMFADAVNDPKTNIALHPEDYVLFEIGTFNVLTGQIETKTLTSIAVGIEFKQKVPSP